MQTHELKDKAEQARRDGFVIVDLEGSPFRLDQLLTFVKSIFPTHTLHQLAITQAEEGQFVIAAELGTETKSN